MCSPFMRKEANRFYWIVKGSLIPQSWSDKDVEGIYYSYMKRIWGNHENCVQRRRIFFCVGRQRREENERGYV